MTSTTRAALGPSLSITPQRSLLRRAAQVLAFPLMWVAGGAFAAWAISSGAELGLMPLIGLFATVGYLLVLERLLPFKREWHEDRQEWVRDLIYFPMNGAIGATAGGVVSGLAVVLATGANGLPLWADIPVAILASTFAGYWWHRLGHTIPFMWRAHGVHHTPDKVNTFNNNVVHAFDLGVGSVMTGLVTVLIGASPEAVFVATLFSTMQNFAVHANADVKLGWLNYVLGGPEQHRLHHSTDVAEAGHFSTEHTLWDHVFGSFTWKPGREPAAIGVVDPLSFPSPKARIRTNALHLVKPQPQRREAA